MGGLLIFKRIESEGLAAFSYFLSSRKEVVVIDPRRDCQIYLDLAKTHESQIKYVFETHRNEDYVIGSIELSHKTGAKIFHGPGLDFRFGETANDDEVFSFGKMSLRTIHTPGHTDESMSYALYDSSLGQNPIMVFTGDALFAGDVGRVDLYGPKETSRLADALFDSIFKRILTLGDGVILCPGHGRGSLCGSDISNRKWTTLGYERQYNPILQMEREEFVRFKDNEKLERPFYFRKMEQYNLEGPPLLDNFLAIPALSPLEFNERIKQGSQVLDTRMPAAFGGAHIKDSTHIWLGGLASYAGWLLSYSRPLVLVLENKEYLDFVVTYMMRLGYDNIEGYLCAGDEACGLESWYTAGLPIDHLNLISVHELKEKIDQQENLVVVDVRSDKEWNQGYIKEALHIFVGHLREKLDTIPTGKPVAAICRVGNRGSLAASILRKEGRRDIFNVIGGMKGWKNAGYPIIVP